jgi:hypothetical protein
LEYNGIKIRRTVATILGLLLLIYIAYQIYLLNYHGITTETAYYSVVPDVVEASGWFVRDEHVVTSDYDEGVLSYNVSDGGKISKGEAIANIYASESDASSQTKIDSISEEIEKLKNIASSSNYGVTNPEQIGNLINTSLVSILSESRNNTTDNTSTDKEHIQLLLTQKSVITGKETSDIFNNVIDRLNAEKDTLNSNFQGCIGTINADSAGYFISETDGYESTLDYNNISDITVDAINNISKKSVETGTIGKIAKSFDWYVVAIVNEEQKIKLSTASSNAYIEIPFVTTEKIPAEVVALNYDSTSGQYAAVLKCSYMNSDIAAVRNEAVQITVHTYSGVLVNQKSVFFNDVTDSDGVVHNNVKGVYVKYGSKIRFVQIFSDITINGYAVCDIDLTDEEKSQLYTDYSIRLYDEVVTGGKNLYDGKLIQ